MPEQDEGIRFARIGIDRVCANPRQPRHAFDEDALAELAGSIRHVGLLQPVLVRPAPDSADADFELVAGERRWRAARLAGLAEIPAVIRQTDDADLLRDALLENLQRANLNPLEEAAAYHQMLTEIGCSHEELAARLGRSRPQITNTIRLLRLPSAVQRRVAAGVLSQGHARALLSLDSPEEMEALANRVVAEGLSVRAVEELVMLGARAPRPRRRSTPQSQPPHLDRIAEALTDRLDTRVQVRMGRNRGRLTIDFAGAEDLERILALLNIAEPSDDPPAS